MDVVREMALILSDRPNSPTGKAIRLREGWLAGLSCSSGCRGHTGRQQTAGETSASARGGFNVINPP
jgi:hypothetical protein